MCTALISVPGNRVFMFASGEKKKFGRLHSIIALKYRRRLAGTVLNVECSFPSFHAGGPPAVQRAIIAANASIAVARDCNCSCHNLRPILSRNAFRSARWVLDSNIDAQRSGREWLSEHDRRGPPGFLAHAQPVHSRTARTISNPPSLVADRSGWKNASDGFQRSFDGSSAPLHFAFPAAHDSGFNTPGFPIFARKIYRFLGDFIWIWARLVTPCKRSTRPPNRGNIHLPHSRFPAFVFAFPRPFACRFSADRTCMESRNTANQGRIICGRVCPLARSGPSLFFLHALPVDDHFYGHTLVTQS